MHTAIVVDDDEVNLELLSELLELNNTKVLAKCINGKEAVSTFESIKPDLVFLDVMMPEYDGLYALEHIRKFDPSAKVIMVTADTTEETEQRLEKLEPSAVIHKPYSVTSILHIIEQLCDREKDIQHENHKK